ncbi:Uncharacterised protein [Mycobacterium tuberculosis]|nr:Uncharacterised protein [Mycobacterium tuberculosis]
MRASRSSQVFSSSGKLGAVMPAMRAVPSFEASLARWIWPARVSMSGARRASTSVARSMPLALACARPLSSRWVSWPSPRAKTGTDRSYRESAMMVQA